MTPEPAPPLRATTRWRAGLIAALLGTISLGVLLRWALAGAVTLPAPFGYLRHAHSHLGYYGLLFPLAWLGWAAAGAAIPGRRALTLYGASTAATFIGFALDGYGPVANP